VSAFTFIVLFNALSFLCYGCSCIYSRDMKREFIRYGMPRHRITVGVAEILGAAGLVMGLVFNWIGILASSGLIILMAMGLVVRFRIGDGILRAFPALLFLILNVYTLLQFVANP